MKFILGKKQNMTQFFATGGQVFPATVVKVMPGVVTQVKTKDNDGYIAAQVGFGEQKADRLNKAAKGHFKDLGNFSEVREYRINSDEAVAVGTAVTLEAFTEGDVIRVSGDTKGKGFQGVVKRHGFHGGPRSHGQKHSEREAGSIGGGLRTHVPKGMRMAGRMGGNTITVSNLKILHIDKDENVMVISGAIPGRRGTLIEIIG
ncbi:MAG TPA: 50S ribosomal protein L3 [Candidatus Paceibacterota bacterium]|nr:50S ribosomal protein L3 [Candidatus Paceibacterota bacterium]